MYCSVQRAVGVNQVASVDCERTVHALGTRSWYLCCCNAVLLPCTTGSSGGEADKVC